MSSRYGPVATAFESPRELETLFDEVEEYFAAGASLSPGAVVVDVGANIGAFAIAAAHRCERDLRLYCFEPVPILFRALEQNLRDNGWLAGSTHRAFNVAVSTPEEAGTPCPFFYFKRIPRDSTMDLETKRAEFEAFFAAQGARVKASIAWLGPIASLVDKTITALPRGAVGRWMSDRVTGLERIEVPRDSLARSLAAEALPRIDLLKIDVEGAEQKVLAGVDEALWSRTKQIVVETDGSEERTRPIIALAAAQGLDQLKVFEPPSTAKRGLKNVIINASRS